jgi:hypothetical protein
MNAGSATCPLCDALRTDPPRFHVRFVEGRWTFGREALPSQTFETKEAAMACARTIAASHPGSELIVEERKPARARRPIAI